MRESEYLGWANYQTWAVGLWLANDQSTWQEVDRLAAEWEEETREGGAVSDLADRLRNLVEDFDAISDAQNTASLAADLIGHALDAVDWLHLAEVYAADTISGETVDAYAEIERRQRLYLDRMFDRLGSDAR